MHATCQWMCASIMRCSMLSQAFNRRCHNLLHWCDIIWRQWHSEKIIKIYPTQIPANFLLLVHYVPNVAKRSTWEQCIYWGPTDRWLTTDLAFWKISNGHILAMDHPIHLMFGSRVGFSRSADRMSLLPVGPNPRSRSLAVLYNFECPYLISLKRFIRSSSYLVLG